MEINENLLKKIKNDRFYSKVYEKYKDFNLLIDAGFIDSQVEAKDFYNLNLLTTPVGKLLQNLNNVKNPVVLLSTGGFLPIHEGEKYPPKTVQPSFSRWAFASSIILICPS